MFNIKTLLMAAAVSAGAILVMPTASQAMPASAPVKMQTAKDGNIVDVRHRRHWRRWARYCGSDSWRCHRRHRYARYRYYPYYYDPYYYGYYEPYPYYGYYGPRYYGPGIGFSFRF
jgi:hypothetical protein